jgi:hypothetical protein
MGSTPNWSGWLASVWGTPYENFAGLTLHVDANNLVFGDNPPYTLQDFLAVYPYFGGPPTAVVGNTTLGSPTITGITDSPTLVAGNPISGPGIPKGALIQSVDGGGQITLNVNATATATAANLQTLNAPLLPFIVLLMFLAMAQASLVQRRWDALWSVGMAFYIAHFATLYLQATSSPNTTAAQAAQSAIMTGIVVSKAVHDVSVGYTPLTNLEEWGAFQLTSFGVQLLTFAKWVGNGPMLLV